MCENGQNAFWAVENIGAVSAGRQYRGKANGARTGYMILSIWSVTFRVAALKGNERFRQGARGRRTGLASPVVKYC